MEKKSNSLPLDVVQKIQSFMNLKEAARSATLCTRLYESWHQTRDIEFDEDIFRDINEFGRAALTTVGRYKESGSSLDRVKIRVHSGLINYHYAEVLVHMVAKLGTGEIKVVLTDEDCNEFRIPKGVFTSGKVVRLSIMGGSLGVDVEPPMSCSSIRFLHLSPCCFVGRPCEFVKNVLLRCPSLEQLVCPGFLLLYDVALHGACSHNLTCLTVNDLCDQGPEFYTETLGIFNNLRRLTLRTISNDWATVRINIPTVEYLSILDHPTDICVEVSAPRLVIFNYEGSDAACIKFCSPVKWQSSNIRIACGRTYAAWFSSLHGMLESCAASSVCLSLEVGYHVPLVQVNCYNNIDPVNIEVLELTCVSPVPFMLTELLRLCDPREIRCDSRLGLL